jgi:hypothetical protein
MSVLLMWFNNNGTSGGRVDQKPIGWNIGETTGEGKQVVRLVSLGTLRYRYSTEMRGQLIDHIYT